MTDAPRCIAWGEWPADPLGEDLRRRGVLVAGPCKRPAGHDGEHSLAKPPEPEQ